MNRQLDNSIQSRESWYFILTGSGLLGRCLLFLEVNITEEDKKREKKKKKTYGKGKPDKSLRSKANTSIKDDQRNI